MHLEVLKDVRRRFQLLGHGQGDRSQHVVESALRQRRAVARVYRRFGVGSASEPKLGGRRMGWHILRASAGEGAVEDLEDQSQGTFLPLAQNDESSRAR